jgi:hypothetical protein
VSGHYNSIPITPKQTHAKACDFTSNTGERLKKVYVVYKGRRADKRPSSGAFFLAGNARQKKPGFPLQVLGFAHANPVDFPLQSLAPPSG